MIEIYSIALPLAVFLLAKKHVPYCATLALEASVAIYAFEAERVRELILFKLIMLGLIVLFDIKFIYSSFLVNKKHLFRKTRIPVFLFFTLFFFVGMWIAIVRAHQPDDIGVALFVLISPILAYFTIFIDRPITRKTNGLATLVILLPTLFIIWYSFSMGLERITSGSMAIGGLYAHLGMIVLLSRVINLVSCVAIGVFCIELLMGNSRRYILPVAVSLVSFLLYRLRLRAVIGIFLASVLISATTLLSYDIDSDVNTFSSITERSLGYRVAEYQYLSKFDDIKIFLTGRGIGASEFPVIMGTKGVVQAGPRFHNYYLTLFSNLGMVYALCVSLLVLYRFAYLYKNAVRLNSLGMYRCRLFVLFGVGWMISAVFDTPPDGLWPIGWALGHAEYSFRIKENNFA